MKVTSKLTSIFNAGGVILYPGVNPDVDKKAFDKVAKTPVMQYYLKQKQFIVEAEPKGFTTMDEVDAIMMVSDTVRKDVLAGWLQEEKASKEPRKAVLSTLMEQLTKITPKGSKQPWDK